MKALITSASYQLPLFIKCTIKFALVNKGLAKKLLPFFSALCDEMPSYVKQSFDLPELHHKLFLIAQKCFVCFHSQVFKHCIDLNFTLLQLLEQTVKLAQIIGCWCDIQPVVQLHIQYQNSHAVDCIKQCLQQDYTMICDVYQTSVDCVLADLDKIDVALLYELNPWEYNPKIELVFRPPDDLSEAAQAFYYTYLYHVSWPVTTAQLLFCWQLNCQVSGHSSYYQDNLFLYRELLSKPFATTELINNISKVSLENKACQGIRLVPCPVPLSPIRLRCKSDKYSWLVDTVQYTVGDIGTDYQLLNNQVFGTQLVFVYDDGVFNVVDCGVQDARMGCEKQVRVDVGDLFSLGGCQYHVHSVDPFRARCLNPQKFVQNEILIEMGIGEWACGHKNEIQFPKLCRDHTVIKFDGTSWFIQSNNDTYKYLRSYAQLQDRQQSRMHKVEHNSKLYIADIAITMQYTTEVRKPKVSLLSEFLQGQVGDVEGDDERLQVDLGVYDDADNSAVSKIVSKAVVEYLDAIVTKADCDIYELPVECQDSADQYSYVFGEDNDEYKSDYYEQEIDSRQETDEVVMHQARSDLIHNLRKTKAYENDHTHKELVKNEQVFEYPNKQRVEYLSTDDHSVAYASHTDRYVGDVQSNLIRETNEISKSDSLEANPKRHQVLNEQNNHIDQTKMGIVPTHKQEITAQKIIQKQSDSTQSSQLKHHEVRPSSKLNLDPVTQQASQLQKIAPRSNQSKLLSPTSAFSQQAHLSPKSHSSLASVKEQSDHKSTINSRQITQQLVGKTPSSIQSQIRESGDAFVTTQSTWPESCDFSVQTNVFQPKTDQKCDKKPAKDTKDTHGVYTASTPYQVTRPRNKPLYHLTQRLNEDSKL